MVDRARYLETGTPMRSLRWRLTEKLAQDQQIRVPRVLVFEDVLGASNRMFAVLWGTSLLSERSKKKRCEFHTARWRV